MTRPRRRGVSRKHRPRPTPKWLLRSEEIDRIAQARCLMVLSVLSGEKPVSDAILEAGISRGTYYQMETRALGAMLGALSPLASAEGVETSPVRQIALLEEKVKHLERAHRRSQRLLLMTRRVMKAPEGRTVSTRSGKARSPRSTRMRAAASKPPASSPAPTGAATP
jgi:hypothetical protein